MWIEKIFNGVLELDTPIGPRYVQPSLVERAFLLWTFRNFFSLPQQVLRPWERKLIDRLFSENRFVSVSVDGAAQRPVFVIGRIERRLPVGAQVFSIHDEPYQNRSVQGISILGASIRKPTASSQSGSEQEASA